MNYDHKYLKYKIKYLNLIEKHKGGNLLFATALKAAALTSKRFTQCPIDDKSIYNEETGEIIKDGKDEIRNKIRKMLNSPEIKNDLKFQQIITQLQQLTKDENFKKKMIELGALDKNSTGPINIEKIETNNKFIPSNITIIDLKNTLKSMAMDMSDIKSTIRSTSESALSMTGFTNKSQKQKYIDEIVSFLDCGCNENGTTVTGLVAQTGHNMLDMGKSFSNFFSSMSKTKKNEETKQAIPDQLSNNRGKVDIRCLFGLTNDLKLPKGDKDLYDLISMDCVTPECIECDKNKTVETTILDNNTAVITVIYPSEEKCLANKIKNKIK